MGRNPGILTHELFKRTPKGWLGEMVAKESIGASIPGAKAWRIAYIFSNLKDHPTISTGLVIAPKDKAASEHRPIIVWAHGTMGAAQNCRPS